MEEPDKGKNGDLKSIHRDEDGAVILNNSTYMNRKSSVKFPDNFMVKTPSNKINYNLYPITLAHSYKSKDNENPFVYSLTEFQPISFLYGQTRFGLNKKKKALDCPSPTFIEYKDFLLIVTPLTKEMIFGGTRKDKALGLVLTDKSISNKFKGIVGDMMKSLFYSIISGKPVSLPVRIFEPKSTLQRITESWAFAPDFLRKANELSYNPVERLKLVIAFSVAGLYISTKQLKPFNPLLGETFQGTIDNHTQIFVEHISHYPTVSRFLMLDDKNRFKFHGYYDFSSKPKSFGSKLIVIQKGPNICEFQNGEKVTYNLPKVKLMNCKEVENRSSQYRGPMVFVDVKYGLKAVVYFGKQKDNVNTLKGFIRRFEFPEKYKFNHDEEVKWAKKKGCENDVLCKISGDWLENLLFDDKTYWNVDNFLPSPVTPIEYPLPSDGRFREDLIWLHRAFFSKSETEKGLYEEFSQQWKLIMELTQRNDREIRKKGKN